MNGFNIAAIVFLIIGIMALVFYYQTIKKWEKVTLWSDFLCTQYKNEKFFWSFISTIGFFLCLIVYLASKEYGHIP